MNKIVVTEINFYPIKPTDKGLIGFASCLFNNLLSLNSIGVYTRLGGDGFRLVFPSRLLPNGKEISTFYPINKETADALTIPISKYIEELFEKTKGGQDGKGDESGGHG